MIDSFYDNSIGRNGNSDLTKNDNIPSQQTSTNTRDDEGLKTISESDCEATENSFSEVTISKFEEQKIRNPRKVSRKSKAVVSSDPTSNTELSSLLRKKNK